MENRAVKQRGWVSKYFDEKGYGFIAMPIKKKIENVFFHISNVEGGLIKQDDTVSFNLIRTDKGLEAKDVQIVDNDLDADR